LLIFFMRKRDANPNVLGSHRTLVFLSRRDRA
jgi:hypothetical protein